MNPRASIKITKKIETQLALIAEEAGLIEDDGSFSYAEVIRRAINDSYKHHSPPPYLAHKKQKSQSKERLTKNKQAEESTPTNEKLSICEQLGGTYEPENRVCRYMQFDKVNENIIEESEQAVPLAQISKRLLETQFIGNWTDEQKRKQLKTLPKTS